MFLCPWLFTAWAIAIGYTSVILPEIVRVHFFLLGNFLQSAVTLFPFDAIFLNIFRNKEQKQECALWILSFVVFFLLSLLFGPLVFFPEN